MEKSHNLIHFFFWVVENQVQSPTTKITFNEFNLIALDSSQLASAMQRNLSKKTLSKKSKRNSLNLMFHAAFLEIL